MLGKASSKLFFLRYSVVEIYPKIFSSRDLQVYKMHPNSCELQIFWDNRPVCTKRLITFASPQPGGTVEDFVEVSAYTISH